MFKISAIILSRNEDEKLKSLIKYLYFCDEIIIADDDSSDNTYGLSKLDKVKIYKVKVNNDFSKVRNEMIDKVRNDWILFIDSDEVPSKNLIKELSLMENTNKDCFYIRRCDIFLGKEVKNGEVKKAFNKGIIRLIKKGSGKWRGKVHEEFVPNNNSRIGSLKGILYHHSHDSIDEFLFKVNRYSTIRALELIEKKNKPSILSIIIFPIGKFLYTFFLLSGFKDGYQGFVYSFMMSFHSFLARSKARTNLYEKK